MIMLRYLETVILRGGNVFRFSEIDCFLMRKIVRVFVDRFGNGPDMVGKF